MGKIDEEWLCFLLLLEDYVRTTHDNNVLDLSEQPSQLADTKICTGWTLVFRKCKKLRLAMGPFQIAIPHVEFNS